MFAKIRAQSALLSLVPLLSLLLILGLATALQGQITKTAFWAQHSQAVLREVAAVTASIDVANHDALQYGVSRNNATYAKFRQAQSATVRHLRALRTLVADNAIQEHRAALITTAAAQVRNVLNRYVDAAQRNDRPAEMAIISDPGTQRIGEELSSATSALELAERHLALLRFDAISADLQIFGRVLIISLIIAIILAALISIQFAVRVVGRLAKVSENATRLSRGETTVPLTGSDEIALLDEQYRTIFTAYQRERGVASLLQRALLPQRLPEIRGIRIDSAYRPAAQEAAVGGDWYDVFRISDTLYGMSIGDVAGHGLRAATVMSAVRQSIRAAALLSADPGSVLAVVNRIVTEDDSNGLVTAFFAIFDTQTGALRYSVAGHPLPIRLHQSGDIAALAGEGLILGADRRAGYGTYETSLEAGSALVLYTDGLVEIESDYFKGIERLVEAIGDAYYNSAENIAHTIQEKIFATAEPRDDSALLFIGVTELGAPRRARSRTWSIDARAIGAGRRVKRALLWHLGQFARADADLSGVELIYGELLGNVARHTPGHAEITLELNAGTAILRVTDRGDTFTATSGLQPEELAESGRGLFLIRALARDLTIERVPGGNRVSAVLPVTLDYSPAAHAQATV